MISGGNEYFHPGQHVVLRVISGHRDGSATSCPGAALYAMLPSIAQAVAKIRSAEDLLPADRCGYEADRAG